jgi:NSS family neurotransmitter:Na+ symporter
VENKGMSRPLAAFTVGGICWVLGIGTVLSFNLWSDYKLLDMTFFDLLDYLTANILLPLGGLLIAVFVGWISKRHLSESELSISSGFFAAWWFVVRFVAPLGIFVIFLNAIGVV